MAWENFCRKVGMEVVGTEQAMGVQVSRLQRGGAAARAGIRPGDLITQLGEKEVASLEDFRSRAAKAVKASKILVRGVRGAQQYFTMVTVN